ncbi:MAG TPA: DUF4920 domain-containing protein [Thermoanaerobaculia bacterium]|nr:DUF4920 domain-containing protein [Thermoanaerobaculia bacterium]HXT50149.1 DUF4920 domain-containing protein [Thermoanaerobaculia bacterium]
MRTRHPLALAAVLALAFACCLPLAASAAATHVGTAITVEQATPIAEILAHPDDHAGRLVRIEGEVSGVCTAAGCWMDLADDKGNSLRVKVEDGVIVFPSDAVGHPAVAQGTVTIEEMSRDKYVDWQRHLAEDAGKTFDESKIGAGPYRLVQLAGNGADIAEK